MGNSISSHPTYENPPSHQSYWLSRITRDGNTLKDAPLEILMNKKVVMVAVKQNGLALAFASPELQNDKQVVTAAVRQNGAAIKHASPDLQDCVELVMAAIKLDGSNVKYANLGVRNDKGIVMTAINKSNGLALKFASPELQNDMQFVKAAIELDGNAIRFASPELRNNKGVVTTAINKSYGSALQYCSPELQNDKHVVMTAIKFDSRTIQFAAPELRNDKEMGLLAVHHSKLGDAIRYVSRELQGNKDFVLAAVTANGLALEFVLPEFRNDKEIVLQSLKENLSAIEYAPLEMIRNDKDVAPYYVRSNPDNIKHVSVNLKRNRDVLVAAGMFDEDHHHHHHQTQNGSDSVRKIVLSTRFSLDASSSSEATNFTKLLKEHEYIRDGKFKIYAPNAFDKKTCDPNWTDFDWPCRGCINTCEYNNVLHTETGHPTDDCCWRYSFRSQLQEAKDTGGFMLQLVEKSGGGAQELGNGQKIERDMAQNHLQMKIFLVYRPMYKIRYEHAFNKHNVDEVVATIKEWYDEGCWDMTECAIIPSAHLF